MTTESLDCLIQNNTGKIKKYLKSYKKKIERDENNLAERLRYVIDDCKDILDPFINRELRIIYSENDKKPSLEHLLEEMNTLRNDMAHGNLDIRLQHIHIVGFIVIEMTLYAMRLKNLGVENNAIQDGINRVFEMNVTIGN